MSRARTRTSAAPQTISRVPVGAPAWVTEDLIERTLRVWQPYYRELLTPDDALAMIQAADRLIETLSAGKQK